MTRFQVFTTLAKPGLHVWRAGTRVDLALDPAQRPAVDGDPWVFECELGDSPTPAVKCQLFEWISSTTPANFEPEIHIRTVPAVGGQLPPTVWLVHGTSRALVSDPRAAHRAGVRIHLITGEKYVHGRLFHWSPSAAASSPQDPTGWESTGPYWDLALSAIDRSYFAFKFLRPLDGGWKWEDEWANRLWAAVDGGEIWVHSDTPDVVPFEPLQRQLRVHFRQEIAASHGPRMRVRQKIGHDFATDAMPDSAASGWTTHRAVLYTGLAYEVQFWNPTLPRDNWEHPDAIRTMTLAGDEEVWTLEGDPTLFAAEPQRTCAVDVTLAMVPPDLQLTPPHVADVWVNRARAPFATRTPGTFNTYPDVLTSFRFLGAEGPEPLERRTVRATAAGINGFAVAGRPAVLGTAPPADLFTDPPFTIRRPGAYEERNELRFVLHAPQLAAAAVRGDWMPSGTELRMRSTRDGTYWWASSPVGSSVPMGYHGRSYRFVADETTHVQDPAAGWVERSSPDASSRLVQSSAFPWTDAGWQTPDWDWLRLYQLRPARFSNRGGGAAPLDQVSWEVTDPTGYFHHARFTALQLMPVNEIATIGWGYDPAFFYAIEESYGGPDALKRLVDACHRRGIAVLLDVVFNHAGTSDNSLWRLNARDFFDGDTAWGAMINFDEPAVRHFFEQNIAYLLREFHVDGFRFDFTRVIIHGHDSGEAHVRRPGSGGGWEFMHGIRGAARAVNPRCILIAEHLPNEWGVTNPGGPLDSQWCDDFHDRLKEASAGDLSVIGRLASACKLSHTHCADWFNVTNYAESHDEVGNENGRIAHVGGFGQGLRRAKVAGAVTLLSRGIPLVFMGGEAGESRQFHSGSRDVLDIGRYLTSPGHVHVREWFNVLLDLRASASIKGPAPLGVVLAEGQLLAITRGEAADFFMLANFGGWSGWRPLAGLNLPWGTYRELWNSTWPAFAVENEGEHTNGGRDARLTRDSWLDVPDYGAVVLERV